MNEFQGLENAEISDRMNEVVMANLSACNPKVSANTLQDPSQTAWEVARQEESIVSKDLSIVKAVRASSASYKTEKSVYYKRRL